MVWFVAAPKALRREAHEAIGDGRNDAFVSPVAIWEISIKREAGKLRAPAALLERLAAVGFLPLDVTWAHAFAAGALPRHHGDPFDRMLVAQARLEGLTLVTRDPVFQRYGVPILAA